MKKHFHPFYGFKDELSLANKAYDYQNPGYRIDSNLFLTYALTDYKGQYRIIVIGERCFRKLDFNLG